MLQQPKRWSYRRLLKKKSFSKSSAKTSNTTEVQLPCFLLIRTQTMAHWHPNPPIKWYSLIPFVRKSAAPVVQEKSNRKFHSNRKRTSEASDMRSYDIVLVSLSVDFPFSSPEPTILLVCGRNRELWEQPFWNTKEITEFCPSGTLVPEAFFYSLLANFATPIAS